MRHRGKPRQSKGNNRGQITRNSKGGSKLDRKERSFKKFISRATDKYMAFFKVLKKAFQWIDEFEESLVK